VGDAVELRVYLRRSGDVTEVDETYVSGGPAGRTIVNTYDQANRLTSEQITTGAGGGDDGLHLRRRAQPDAENSGRWDHLVDDELRDRRRHQRCGSEPDQERYAAG